jgi:hypothetical protein
VEAPDSSGASFFVDVKGFSGKIESHDLKFTGVTGNV